MKSPLAGRRILPLPMSSSKVIRNSHHTWSRSDCTSTFLSVPNTDTDLYVHTRTYIYTEMRIKLIQTKKISQKPEVTPCCLCCAYLFFFFSFLQPPLRQPPSVYSPITHLLRIVLNFSMILSFYFPLFCCRQPQGGRWGGIEVQLCLHRR